ncbi:hypothetical protein [Streptomyces olivochromogenes]|uniref:HK97 gp10 family phage protein n=1 Tax=Streptomyces olivochromogenes TaxID=1963 RepID=A0A250VTB2_STROL|nr:hypothetical protein [Streptomyces olivochromogenes]KUN38225.1 hypothetical protein AQJ27_44800 [Streptomyces olivochromogenes]GAX57336.1 hypothetical protein SO3561_08906 [Streptomyces olivochromogenes]
MAGIDVIGLTVVVDDLGTFAERLRVNAGKAVKVTSQKVRDDARNRIKGHKYLPAYPYSITYDVKVTAEGVEGEIGPDKGMAQGPLGNIIEYGTSKNAPLPHLGPALDANAEDLVTGIEIAVHQAM